MGDLSYTILRLLPKNTLSRALGAVLRAPMPQAVHRAIIRRFVKAYGVDAAEAELDGLIEGYSYVPGMLWPVNAVGVRNVEKLFCVNERLTTWLRTPAGPCAVVAVGATNVGRIRAVYDDVVTNHRRVRAGLRKR